jgi:hypothetical protein
MASSELARRDTLQFFEHLAKIFFILITDHTGNMMKAQLVIQQ